MPTYRIAFAPRARKQFLKLPKAVQERLRPRIDALADEPRPTGVTKLKGAGDLYRIRVGNYRVVYQIRDDTLLVLITEARHRREVYR